MFILRDYIKNGFLNAVGKMADYQIILNSVGYFEKGVLTEDDLAEIETRINAQYPQPYYPENIVGDEQITDGVIEDNIETEEQPIEETEVIS